MAAGRARRILFRIFYSTSFTIVFLLTIAFCCAGPIDIVYQSWRRDRLIDIFIVAGIYVLTALIAIFLYASRLYTNRSILKDIPKTYVPLDKAELPGKKVWRLIEDCKSRSAVIAYQARPRSRRIECELSSARERIHTLLKPEHSSSRQFRSLEPQWGIISHPGRSSPAAAETPNLEYETVVKELMDLIEARAVSLAPVNKSTEIENDLSLSDEYIIEALHRPQESGMRQYVSQLISLDVLRDNSLTVAFLTLYERARFAPEPLSEDEFKTLMRVFAEILRTMKTLDVSRLDVPLDYDSYSVSDDHLENTDKDRQPARTKGSNSRSSAILHNLGALTLVSSNSIRTSPSTSSLADSISISGSVRRNRTHHIPSYTPPFSATLDEMPTSHRATSYTTAVPRMSEDSPRSLSSASVSHEGFADFGADRQIVEADNSTDIDNDMSWTATTSRPPFLRAPSSRSTTKARSQPLFLKTSSSRSIAKTWSKSHSTIGTDKEKDAFHSRDSTLRFRSRLRGMGSKNKSKNSLDTSSIRSAASMASVRSNIGPGSASGSVIRLRPDYDGSREQLPFEYVWNAAHDVRNEEVIRSQNFDNGGGVGPSRGRS